MYISLFFWYLLTVISSPVLMTLLHFLEHKDKQFSFENIYKELKTTKKSIWYFYLSGPISVVTIVGLYCLAKIAVIPGYEDV